MSSNDSDAAWYWKTSAVIGIGAIVFGVGFCMGNVRGECSSLVEANERSNAVKHQAVQMGYGEWVDDGWGGFIGPQFRWKSPTAVARPPAAAP